MKYLIYILVISSLLQARIVSDEIKNTTKEDMICIETYPSVYKTKKENDLKKKIKILDEEKITKIIKPKESIIKKRDGELTCYNQYEKITSLKNNKIEETNKSVFYSFLNNHNKYNLRQYENKTKEYVEQSYPYLSTRCAPFKKGEYCTTNQGFDIVYDKNKKINSIFLYNQSLASSEGRRKDMLPFKPKSILKLYSDNQPLGLWVVKDYKKLFSKKPTIVTNNLIMWENLSKHIKRVIMIPLFGRNFVSYNKNKDGKYLYGVDFKYAEKPKDYLKVIQIEYR